MEWKKILNFRQDDSSLIEKVSEEGCERCERALGQDYWQILQNNDLEITLSYGCILRFDGDYLWIILRLCDSFRRKSQRTNSQPEPIRW